MSELETFHNNPNKGSRKPKQYKSSEDSLKIKKHVSDTKQCHVCGETKDISEFYAMHSGKDGYRKHCKSCDKEKHHQQFSTLDGFIKSIMYRTKQTAKQGKMEFSITSQDILDLFEKQGGKCAITGIELTHLQPEEKGNAHRHLYNISIDRIDGEKHYTLDNIHLVCYVVNRMRWLLPMKEFSKICEKIVIHNKL